MPEVVLRWMRVAILRDSCRTSMFCLIPSHLTFPFGKESLVPTVPTQSARPLRRPGALPCHLGPETQVLISPSLLLGCDVCGVSCGKGGGGSGVCSTHIPCTYIVPTHRLGQKTWWSCGDCGLLLCPHDLWPRVPRDPLTSQILRS